MSAAPDIAIDVEGLTKSFDGRTVVDSTGDVPKLLRAGAVEWAQILDVAGGN